MEQSQSRGLMAWLGQNGRLREHVGHMRQVKSTSLRLHAELQQRQERRGVSCCACKILAVWRSMCCTEIFVFSAILSATTRGNKRSVVTSVDAPVNKLPYHALCISSTARAAPPAEVNTRRASPRGRCVRSEMNKSTHGKPVLSSILGSKKSVRSDLGMPRPCG